MSNPINDGGPAFPSPPSQNSNGFYSTGNGMTLRDYFAAAALQGFCANQHWNPTQSVQEDAFANIAFIAADAMLKAREVKP